MRPRERARNFSGRRGGNLGLGLGLNERHGQNDQRNGTGKSRGQTDQADSPYFVGLLLFCGYLLILAYTSTLTAMGNLRPMPNDLGVTLRTGAACWRLYSNAPPGGPPVGLGQGRIRLPGQWPQGFRSAPRRPPGWGREPHTGAANRYPFDPGGVPQRAASRGLRRGSLRLAIEPAAHCVDARLDQVADHRQRAHHVSIKRAVADRHL